LKTYNFWVMLVREGVSQYMARTTTLTPEERAEKRKEYLREWNRNREKNPDRKEYMKNYRKNYDPTHRTAFCIHLMNSSDSEIIKYLKGLPESKNSYIKRLIQEDMSRNKPEK